MVVGVGGSECFHVAVALTLGGFCEYMTSQLGVRTHFGLVINCIYFL